MKKAIKIILWSLLGLLVLTGVYSWTLFGPLVRGAMSVQKRDVGLYEWDHRFDQLCQQLDEAGGVMDLRQLTTSIASVAQPAYEGELGTAWTVVMDLTNPSATYYSRRHFDQPFHFKLNP